MSDPVIGSDGRSYERAAIIQWLRSNPHSPITRQPMTVASLKPNYALRTAIERYNAAPPRPPMVYQTAPSAPPADDLYYAIQVHQDLNQNLLQQQQQQNIRYGPAPVVLTTANPTISLNAERRRRQFCVACVFITVVVIFIIIISRLFLTSNN